MTVRRRRTGPRRGTDGASAIPPLLDALERLGVNPAAFACCCSMTRRLRAAYSGAAFRATRASDSTNLDVGFGTGSQRNFVDLAPLQTFIAGTTAVVSTLYDQSASGQALTGTTRPSVTSAAGVIARNAGQRVCAIFDGVNDRLVDATGPGLAGNAALCLIGTTDLVAAAPRTFMSYGYDLSNRGFRLSNTTLGPPGTTSTISAGTTSAIRVFNNALAPGTSSTWWIAQKAAGALAAAFELYEGGNTCTQSSVTNPAQPANFGTRSDLNWGCALDSVASAIQFFSGKSNAALWITVDLTAVQRAAVDREMQRFHV